MANCGATRGGAAAGCSERSGGQMSLRCAGGFAGHRSEVMAWLYLLVAGLLEVGWAIGLKFSDGFSRPWPSVWTAVAMILSLAFLALALKTLPVGTAYAVWTGIGAIGTVILGIWLFGEPATALRLACIGLILAGIVGLRLVS
jgi:quaternary ammonium compound-resistance protein SugE